MKKVTAALGAWRIESRLSSVSPGETHQLRLAREAYPGAANTRDPLVTVTVPTFNRAQLLTERCLPSILGQTYPKLEIVVVGDHCTDDTAERISALGDERVRFINLDEPSAYPPPGIDRWRVAGSIPINRALFEATGDWLAYMDDDDEMLPHRIERSLEAAAKSGAELVCGRIDVQQASGQWDSPPVGPWPTGQRPFRPVGVPHSAAMYRSYLRFILYDSRSYEVGLPTDRHWVYRMARAGVRAVLIDEVLTRVPRRPAGSQESGGPSPGD